MNSKVKKRSRQTVSLMVYIIEDIRIYIYRSLILVVALF